mgnify:FL=1
MIFMISQFSWGKFAYDISVCIFSAMILIWFIDEINKHLQDKKNKTNEIEKIKRANRILEKYIDQYWLYFYCLTTPVDQRNFDNPILKSNFLLQDMQDLYTTTLLVSDALSRVSIESFINSEADLINEIKVIVREIDFFYYPYIQECLLSFIEVSLKYNNYKGS